MEIDVIDVQIDVDETTEPSVDTSSYDQLAPSQSNQVKYAENGINYQTQKHQMGTMSINYAYTTVKFNHSDCLSVTYDPIQGLIITFSSPESYSIAQSGWSLDNGLLLTTYTEGCGDAGTPNYYYFQVKTITDLSDLTCVVQGLPVDHLTVFISTKISGGTYYLSTLLLQSYSGTGGGNVSNTASENGTTTDSDEVAGPLCGPLNPVYDVPSASLGVEFDG
ncbi:hypothetical protein BP5796_12433 [Coleophoma crateriformis]|uniref:DUF7029 domain-containing protein n=1 Tax=Coleophoma crateriformis TaxID=565419 RepID=A0A3D8Q9I3_9HELO|nr:hypothetical protein BP5796_12433 [Coleophoma crateriformis]